MFTFLRLRRRTSSFFSAILPHHAPPADEYAIATGLGCPIPPPHTPSPQDRVRPKVKRQPKKQLPHRPPIARAQTMSAIDHHCVASDEFKAFAGFFDVDVSARRWSVTEGIEVNDGEESDGSSVHAGMEFKVLPRPVGKEVGVLEKKKKKKKERKVLCCIAP
ncbi:hypothetical protein K440DRAFT_681346 [Wilcoxina mikolae CBS 423.85]|nr:hypothetical protein K440DRAFT_681346 [Wilcoxina mikolae CBS 423.85]